MHYLGSHLVSACSGLSVTINLVAIDGESVSSFLYSAGVGCYANDFDEGEGSPVGSIVIMRRGGCNFVEKVMNAQKQGALGAVISDNKKQPLITLTSPAGEAKVTIPSGACCFGLHFLK
jgi:hypothetical protein